MRGVDGGLYRTLPIMFSGPASFLELQFFLSANDRTHVQTVVVGENWYLIYIELSSSEM